MWPNKDVEMNRAILEELFDQLSAPLTLYARQWCNSPDDAVQEAFVDLSNCKNIPQSPKAWLYTTTRRKAQNIARAEVRRNRHQHNFAHQRSSIAPSEDWFSKSENAALVPEDVVQSLQRLPTDQREILVARVWGELNFEELSILIGCSVSSAHRRYAAALQRLKSIIERDDANTRGQTDKQSDKQSGNYAQVESDQNYLADGE